MLTYGAVLHHDNTPYTAARTWVLLEHFNYGLFDQPLYSPELAPSTYLKDWLWSQRFNDNEELMEGVKTCLSSHAADFFDTDMRNLFPATSSSIPAVTTLSMQVFLYTAIVSLLDFLTIHWRLLPEYPSYVCIYMTTA
jgi:hypothetical protein